MSRSSQETVDNLHPMRNRVNLQKIKRRIWLDFMKCPHLQKMCHSPFLCHHIWVGWGVRYKKLARNYMEYSDMHRKIMAGKHYLHGVGWEDTVAK